MTEVRALICSPSDHNRTILLSSHILREFEKVFDIFTIITDGVLVLQSQMQGEASFVMADARSGLMAPPPAGPLQYRFRRGRGLPDQVV